MRVPGGEQLTKDMLPVSELLESSLSHAAVRLGTMLVARSRMLKHLPSHVHAAMMSSTLVHFSCPGVPWERRGVSYAEISVQGANNLFFCRAAQTKLYTVLTPHVGGAMGVEMKSGLRFKLHELPRKLLKAR